MTASVHVHIERIVLDSGFAHLDRGAVRIAVQAELTRLLTERGAPPATLQESHGIRKLDAGGFHLSPSAGAKTIGQQLAQRVHEGLEG